MYSYRIQLIKTDKNTAGLLFSMISGSDAYVLMDVEEMNTVLIL
jgi:hypothetical protein